MAAIMAWLPVAWVTGLGLLFDVVGATVLAWPLIEPEKWASAADEKPLKSKECLPRGSNF